MSENRGRKRDIYVQRQAELRERIESICQSPRTREKMQIHFEDLLKDINYFDRPDIVPYPKLDLTAFQTNKKQIDTETHSNWKELHEHLENLTEEKQEIQRQNRESSFLIESLQRENEELKLKIHYLEAHEREILLMHQETVTELREIKLVNGKLESNLDYIQKKLEETSENKILDAQNSLVADYQSLQNAYNLLTQSYNSDLQRLNEQIEDLKAGKIRLETEISDSSSMKELIVAQKTILELEGFNETADLKIEELESELSQIEMKFEFEVERNKEITYENTASNQRILEIEQELNELKIKYEQQRKLNHDNQKKRNNTNTSEDFTPKIYVNWSSSGEKSPPRLPLATSRSKPRLKINSPSRKLSGINSSDRSSPMSWKVSSPRNQYNLSPRSEVRKAQTPTEYSGCETCRRRHKHSWFNY